MNEDGAGPRGGLRDPVVWAWVGLGALLRFAYLALYPVVPARGDEGLHYVGGALVSMLGTEHLGHWGPGYEVLLGMVFWITGAEPVAAKVLQILLSLVTVLLLALLTRRTGGVRAGRIAAALAAVYPSFVAYSQFFFTETLYITLLVAAVSAFFLRSPGPRSSDLALSGALFGLASLTRSVALYFFPIWIGWAWLRGRPEEARRVAIVFGISLLVIAPWSARNFLKYDGFVLVDGTFGRTAYLAFSEVDPSAPSGRDLGLAGRERERVREACEEQTVADFPPLPPTQDLAARFPEAARKLLPKGALERKIDRAAERGALDILARQRCESSAALDFASRHPTSVFAHIAWRLYAFAGPNSFLLRAVSWGVYPDGPLVAAAYPFVKVTVVVTESGLLLFALLALLRPRQSPLIEWSLLFGLFYVALHAVSAASSRYRLPLMAFAILLSALFLASPSGPSSRARGAAVLAVALSGIALSTHYVLTVLP